VIFKPAIERRLLRLEKEFGAGITITREGLLWNLKVGTWNAPANSIEGCIRALESHL